MKRRGRPPKITETDNPDRHAPIVLPKAANKPMEAALEMAEGLLKMYKDEKQGIQYKYRECDYYKEGADYKVQLSQSIGGIKAMKLLINQIKEQLK